MVNEAFLQPNGEAFQQYLAAFARAVRGDQAEKLTFSPEEQEVYNLLSWLDPSQLRTLCHRLNLHYENLPGEDLVAREVSLVRQAERTNTLDKLKNAIFQANSSLKNRQAAHSWSTEPRLQPLEKDPVFSPEAQEVYDLLDRGLNKEGFKTVCFILALDYDRLRGEFYADKVTSLVRYAERTNSLDKLKYAIFQANPHLKSI